MKHMVIVITLFLAFGCSSTSNTPLQESALGYHYFLNLKALQTDKLQVTLEIDRLDQDVVAYCFPKIVPGIYGVMNFGQYISSLEAIDDNGKPLEVRKIDENCWEISGAKRLERITYQVDDAWEEFDISQQKGFYRSAASSFKEDVFVINNNCLFGYFKGEEDWPVHLVVERPDHLYGATSLNKKKGQAAADKDIFTASDYHQLVDNPILYAVPDTTLIHLPEIEVEVACYSNSGEKLSKEIAKFIEPLLKNQSIYLGGQLPVSKYTFLIYHHFDPELNGYAGDGLEHSYSTLILYCMPKDLEILRQSTYQIASHEFFHILMPLGLHSHEIADYDFNDPKFSKHLWLYEGMTEYFTIHMPIKNGIQTLPDFVKTLERKIKAMQEYDNTIPLTELSADAMNRQDQYYNVYLKGALLNLCLDIELRELSKGAYGVQNLVFDLIQEYGRDKPFADDDLFGEIVKTTGFPKVDGFIDRYISGSDPLPLEEQLHKVGFDLDRDSGQIKTRPDLTAAQKKLRQYWINQ